VYVERKMLVWKSMLPHHLGGVLSIADIVHTDYPESATVYEERLALFPEGCWVAVSTQDDGSESVSGYAITHPGVVGQPPPLNSLLVQLPVVADCLYLHDVAILPSARQYGLGGKLIAHSQALAIAKQIPQMALVAVNQSAPYWQRQGFAAYAQANQVLLAKLRSYSDDAQYLVKNLF
jgi:GNAT superfamily N-acetyltransferase